MSKKFYILTRNSGLLNNVPSLNKGFTCVKYKPVDFVLSFVSSYIKEVANSQVSCHSAAIMLMNDFPLSLCIFCNFAKRIVVEKTSRRLRQICLINLVLFWLLKFIY